MATSENNKDVKYDKDANKIKDDFAAQFNDIIDGAERLLKETAEQTDDKTSELRTQLTNKISHIRASMGEHLEPVCEKGKEMAKATNDYVKHHPWISLGVVAVTAVVVSKLFHRR